MMETRTVELYEAMFTKRTRELPEHCPACSAPITEGAAMIQWNWHDAGIDGTLDKNYDDDFHVGERHPREGDAFYPSELRCECGAVLASADL